MCVVSEDSSAQLDIEQTVIDLGRTPKKLSDVFARWAYAVLSRSPFAELRSLDDDRRVDIIEEVIIHFVSNQCRVLKKYSPQGGKFLSWFYCVARNKALDLLRSRAYQPSGVPLENGDRAGAVLGAEKDIHLMKLVWECIGQLREKCQVLLKLASEEYTPKEMTVALGLKSTDNQKVADDLRYCRKQLMALLDSRGVSGTDIFDDL